MKKLSLFLATAFMALSFSAKAQVTVVDSGSCGTQGNNLTWTLYSDSVLTIKGSGAMTNYNIFSPLHLWRGSMGEKRERGFQNNLINDKKFLSRNHLYFAFSEMCL